MKNWIPLLAILAAGLLIGVIGARMVDSGTTRVSEAGRSSASAAPAPYAQPSPAPSRPERGDRRPGLDWDEEAWLEDHRGYSAGPYDYGDDYFGARDPALADEEGANDAAPPSGPARETAAAAAQAGERAAAAASDAARVAAQASPPAAPRRPTRPAPPPPEAAPREPRTADGELPAIW